jgi:hypothetical protein
LDKKSLSQVDLLALVDQLEKPKSFLRGRALSGESYCRNTGAAFRTLYFLHNS